MTNQQFTKRSNSFLRVSNIILPWSRAHVLVIIKEIFYGMSFTFCPHRQLSHI